MKEGDQDIPVACTLTNAEFRRRERTLLARFRSAVIEEKELPGGYKFCIAGEDHWIAAVAELIAAERQCCPFLKFELIVTSNVEFIILRVTGPAGAKDFLRITFCKPESSK